MTRRVDGGTGQEWTTFLEELVGEANLIPNRMAVLPVALEQGGFDLTERRHMVQALQSERSFGGRGRTPANLGDLVSHRDDRATPTSGRVNRRCFAGPDYGPSQLIPKPRKARYRG